MPINFNLILLLIVVGISIWLTLRANRPLKEEALKLTVDQARTFHTKFRKKEKRADMPEEFRHVAEASDRARSVTLMAAAASAASIAAYVLIGG